MNEILEELSETEVTLFFDQEWSSIKSWIEGEGRGQSNFEILEANGVYIIASEHYAFDEFAQPTYYFINYTNPI